MRLSVFAIKNKRKFNRKEPQQFTQFCTSIDTIYSSSLFTPNSIFKMPVQTDNIKLKNKAHQKLSTLNPLTNFSARMIITALMTSKKKPSVNNVIGMVKIVSMGFTMVFKKAKTMATISAST
jgi:hypothetical protein